jgi:hypothetical protein
MKCPSCAFDNPGDTRFCGQCGASLRPAEPPPVSVTETIQTPVERLAAGHTFAGRYQILEEIGEGGMGRVYRALDRDLDEKVAIKLIKSRIASDEKMLQRFRNEIKLARKIVHKNVCRMFDLNKTGETHYITMEYISGEDLKTSLRRIGALSVGKTLNIAEQICAGLAEAHRLGVIHRDLKPQNIMIDREGNVRIMDFGIARDLTLPGMTDEGHVVGTLEYMPPEQLEGMKADIRSDIYSIGAIMYELVTGHIPFEGQTPMSIAAKHISAVPVEPRVLNVQIPERLNRAIMKCLEKDREKRFQTVEDLRTEILSIREGVAETTALRAKKAPTLSKVVRAGGKRKWILIPAAALAAAAGIILLTTRRNVPTPPRFETQAAVAGENAAPGAKNAEDKPVEKTDTRPAPMPAATEPNDKAGPPSGRPSEAPARETAGKKTGSPDAALSVKDARPPSNLEPPSPGASTVQEELNKARQAMEKGDDAAVIDAAGRILGLDPGNAEARTLLEKVDLRIKERVESVKGMAAKYVEAFNGRNLPEFYRENASPELYQSVKADVELISKIYDNFQSTASNIRLSFPENGRAEMSFSNIAMAERREDGRKQVLFEGSCRWTLEKRNERWTIIEIETVPAGKK